MRINKRRNKNKFIRFIKSVIVLLVIIFALYSLISRLGEYFDKTSDDGNSVLITIDEGSSSKMIAKQLKELGLIKYEGNFLSRLKHSQYADSMRFGTYELHYGMCIDDIISALATNVAITDDVRVTIPEGFSVEKIAVLMEEKGLCTFDEFLNALSDSYDYSFINDIPEVDYKYKLQGFLFPNTYTFSKDTTAHNIINVMLGEFERQYNSISLGNTTSHSMYEIITKASLIERESMIENERYLISGVIENRLEKNMPLQIDATVLYAITDGLYDANVVLYKDLESDSLYNTYKYYGLPVGPICNPGLSSIDAALKPDNNNYLYYHTDEVKGDGSHIFTETLDEHNATMQY